MLQLLALLRQLGPKAAQVMKFLSDHADCIQDFIDLFSDTVEPRFQAAGEITEDQFVAECKSMGCDESECREVLSHLDA